MIDLDPCHKDLGRKINNLDRGPSESLIVAPPLRLPPITTWFAALETLKNLKAASHAPRSSQPTGTVHHIHHDLESLIWVATYSLYQRAYEISMYPQSGWDVSHQEVIEDALNTDFGNSDAGTVESRRKAMASRGLSGLYSVLRYFDDELRDFVLGLMDLVHAQNRNDLPALPHTATSSVPQMEVEVLTCESLRRYIDSYISEHCNVRT
ncbi:uncharacterized protein PHACADRAFT_29005 [Phanerochaete carnosa HHB-10118-sp]|uniref:Uncharacterized protein n=1 Tax=Phanerochaete carnosa (strain HHB-10118-sp) TaxID=650164 RepID=K5WZT9_PHACS|nr:uncharacterized protein PHACADRAFT_29005 [Phanerochaete carnosa HHB-10118-sp]EKM56037.1 hypothetical protein PHACADRAFT_29005 [Phanerochaete carnosa HHB-10118-sp]